MVASTIGNTVIQNNADRLRKFAFNATRNVGHMMSPYLLPLTGAVGEAD